jgi:acyl-CoA synthetase (AMP-forming)/AMP-acid ligase II/thioesterase domain-containing protein
MDAKSPDQRAPDEQPSGSVATADRISAPRLHAVARLQAACLRELAQFAEEAPDVPALLAPGNQSLSFRNLTARIARVAEALREAGMRPGDLVAVAMPDGIGLLTTLLGTLETAAVVPIDWQLTEAELRSRLTLLPACALLVLSAADGHAAPVARTLGIPVFELDFAADGELIPRSDTPLDRRRESRAPETCALVLQTSGTSGEAKLVPFTHTNLHAICRIMQRGLAFHAGDRYLSIMPLHHILGFSSALGQLMIGGSVACTGFDAQRFLAWMEELSPTWYSAGPALHQAILEIAKQDPGPFRRSPLRFVRCGSGAASPALLDNLESVLQVDVINGYGLTEVGSATNTPPGLPRKPGSVGRTMGSEVAIMDASGTLLPTDTEGEVVLRGDAVMDGYLGAEEANREAFRNGWFRTGDLGRMDHEGDLFITGRIKEIINRGGETIGPLEIDHALAEHPAIARAASFGVPHPTLGEDIVAAVVLRPGGGATASQVRSFLAERLSRSKIPSRIWFADSIPVSASGKPLRDSLSKHFQSSAGAAESQQSPVPEDESSASLRHRIGEVWMRVLGSDLPGAEDNFFAMGGDSLSAARMFTLLEAEFQLNETLEPAKFFDSPTFFQLAAVVAARVQRENGSQSEPAEMRFENVSAVCLQPSGVGPPLFFFPGENAEPWYLRHVSHSLGDQQPFFALRHRMADAAEFPAIASRFVTLISRIQPHGPIVLAGHCYGGILAYEVAQRLIGESRVGVAVVLVDVATPGYPKVRASSYLRHLPGALRALLRGEGQSLAAELAEHFRFIRAHRRGKSRAQQELSVARSAPPENAPVAANPVPANPVAANPVLGTPAPSTPIPSTPIPGLSPYTVVLKTYVPRPFSGLLANVLAGDCEVSERVLEDSRKGWREFARGPLQECAVPGQHISIFDAQNAPLLANFIRSAIEKLVVTTRPAVP